MDGIQRGFVEATRIKRAQEQGKEAAMKAQQVFLRRAEIVRNNASPRFVAGFYQGCGIPYAPPPEDGNGPAAPIALAA